MADPTKTSPCPICQRPATSRFRPFCSARCADVDLGRWFNESYRIPAGAPDPQGSEDDNFTG